jgi:hypothetical protein
MANHAKLTFALPEDTDSDYFQIWSSATKTGVYAQVGADIDYEYGTVTYEFEDLSTTTWYKIRFYNLTDTQYGPYSDPVYGGDWEDSTKPFLAVSTTSDGANYASIQDVFDYSGLTTEDVTEARVSQALRRSRAIVDLRTAEMGLDRFNYTFNSATTRRKYNASLRIVKEAEICFALGMAYRGLSDDEVISGIREPVVLSNMSVGQTSIAVDKSKKGIANSNYFSRLAQKYTLIGASMLQLLQPSSVTLSWKEPSTRLSRVWNWRYRF